MKTNSSAELSYFWRLPAEIAGAFVLDGATNPSDFAGHIESVTRLVTSGPAPFFRVRFVEPIPNLGSRKTIITGNVRAPEGTDLNPPNFSTDGYTANPANAIEEGREMDVQVLEAGTAVDTAGRVVNFRILLDQAVED